MKRKISSKFSFVCLIFLVFSAASLIAGPTNGNFASGLDAWNHEFGNVDASGGSAIFEEHPTIISSTLSQVFTLDADSWMLSFDMVMSVDPGGNHHSPNWSDTFTASLLDPVTLAPLASNPTYTDFYYHDRAGVIETVAVVNGNTISLDVSALAGNSVLLSFDLFGSDDGYFTTVIVDDVKVSSFGPVVPVPSALLLGLAGTGFVGYFRRIGRAK